VVAIDCGVVYLNIPVCYLLQISVGYCVAAIPTHIEKMISGKKCRYLNRDGLDMEKIRVRN